MKPSHLLPLLLLALAALYSPSASAATFRVDDTGTIVSAPTAQLRWRNFVPGRAADHTAEVKLSVALKLNVAQWYAQKKPVRIYHRLAATNHDDFTATWSTQGRLLPGSLRGGGRTLIFEGVLTSPSLDETIELTIAADGRRVTAIQSLQFYFELDTQ
jgi:hypothetical protein